MLQPRRKPLATYGKRSKPAPARLSGSEDEKENTGPRIQIETPKARIVVEDSDDEVAELLGTPPPSRPSKLKPRPVVRPSPLRPAVIRRRLKSPQPPIQPPVLDSDSSSDEIVVPVASTSKLPATCARFDPSIAPLLDFCGQVAPYDFTSLVDRPPLDLKHPIWRKLGEATYSEVFTVSTKSAKPADAIVAKIIPLRTRPAPSEYSVDEDEMPEATEWTDALRELRTTRLLGDDERTPGFVQLKSAFVVQGAYPETLLGEWDAYADRRESLNVRPDDQLYVIICLPYQGVDIESVRLSSWTEAASIILQVARSLAAAEEEHNFEHRDLHWGNVLVAKVSDTDRLAANLARTGLRDDERCWPTTLEAEASGVRTTIIDYTLSRIDTAFGAQWSEIDECVFEGEGDAQFDVYRSMRDVATPQGDDEADWSAFHSITNLQWLHYLVGKLLRDKHLHVPTVAPTTERSRRHAQPARKPTSPADRTAYNRLSNAEDMLSKSVDLRRIRRLKKPSSTLFATSRAFVEWFESP